MDNSRVTPEQLAAMQAELGQTPTPTSTQTVQGAMSQQTMGVQGVNMQQATVTQQYAQNPMGVQQTAQQTPINGNVFSSPLQNSAQMGGMAQQQVQGMGMTQATPTTGKRPSRQELLRAQMHTGQQGANGQQVVLQQTDGYNPQGVNGMAQGVGPQTSQQATSTIINTTNSDDKPKPNKNLIWVGAAAVLAVVLVGYFLFGKSDDTEDATASTDDIFSDEGVEYVDPLPEIFAYTADETDQLRAAGYTGDEIENYQTLQMPFDDLILQAEAEQAAFAAEYTAALYDTASPEYLHSISQTWLTMDQRSDMQNWDGTIAAYYQEEENLDYEKIDVYGNQLFIKVFLDDNAHEDWFFLNVTPEEWLQLEDSGNVVVDYTYCTHWTSNDASAVEDTENIYITSATLNIITKNDYSIDSMY